MRGVLDEADAAHAPVKPPRCRHEPGLAGFYERLGFEPVSADGAGEGVHVLLEHAFGGAPGPCPSEDVDDGQRPPRAATTNSGVAVNPLRAKVYTPSPGSVPVKDTANCFSPPATPPGPRSATDASTTDHCPAAEVEVNVEPTCGVNLDRRSRSVCCFAA